MKKNKFKVGDLVVLSAAGRKTSQNWRYKGGYGVVLEVYSCDRQHHFPINCHWIPCPTLTMCRPQPAHFKPYELKFLKPDKK